MGLSVSSPLPTQLLRTRNDSLPGPRRFTLVHEGNGYGILDRANETVYWCKLPSGKPLGTWYKENAKLHISHRDQYTVQDAWSVVDMLNCREAV